MQKIINIDWLLLGLMEQFSYKIQKLCGHTCFSQGRFLAIINVVTYVASFIIYLYINPDEVGFKSLVFYYAITVFFSILNVSSTLKDIHESERNLVPQTFNLERIDIRWMGMRFLHIMVTLQFALGFSITGTSILLIMFFHYLFWTICYYLKACTPLPPCDGKIKKFFQSLSLGKLIPQRA